MARWEYKVVPAPTKGVKGKGVKGPEGRFANALETLMNDMGGDGWEFQRAETLPSIERAGLTGSTTEWRNVLVFRRTVASAMDDFEPEMLPAPDPVVPAPVVAEPVAPEAEAQAEVETDAEASDAALDDTTPGPGATEMLPDNGVEETSDVSGMTTSLKKLASRRGGSQVGDG